MKEVELKVKIDDITFQRGSIMINFAWIEKLLRIFIIRHYFGAENKNFEDELLSNKSFSFFLLQSIFVDILKKHYPESWELFSNKRLNELRDTRNIVAHALLKTIGKDGTVASIHTVCLEHAGNTYIADDLFKQYWDNKTIIQPLLVQIIERHFGAKYLQPQ